MTGLKRSEIEQIVAYHLAHVKKFLKIKANASLETVFCGRIYSDDVAAARRWMQRTRFYHYLTLCGDDVEVRTVAVKADRGGETHVKEVIRACVSSEQMHARDICYQNMSGYRVDWSPEMIGRNCEWNDTWEGIWVPQDYSRRGMWRLQCAVINPEVLGQSERWKYNSWQPACGDILGYLKLYSAHPRIEMLVKMGFPAFAAMPGFVRQLESDRGFMRFLSRNAQEIKADNHGADVVRKAYRMGVSFDRAWSMIAARRSFNGNLPRQIDAEKAKAYINTQNGMTNWEYCRYLEQCVELGQNIADTKVAFPRDGHRRMQQVEEMIVARQTAKDKAARRALARDLKARAERFGAVCEKVDGGFVAHVPKKESEFKSEGKALDHCVGMGSYAMKMARGESLIVFVRSAEAPDKPFVTVELNPVSGKVLQCYGEHNSKPEKEVLMFVEKKVAPAVARIAKREAAKEDKKLTARRCA